MYKTKEKKNKNLTASMVRGGHDLTSHEKPIYLPTMREFSANTFHRGIRIKVPKVNPLGGSRTSLFNHKRKKVNFLYMVYKNGPAESD